MTSNLSRRGRAGVIAALALIAIAFAGLPIVSPVSAHEGHDHGEKPKVLAQTAAPRLTLHSEIYQLVAILKDGGLKVFLDAATDNAPVTDAKLSLSVGEVTLEAKLLPDGTYLAEGGPLRVAARHEVIITITAPSGDDLLIGTLDLSRPNAAQSETKEAKPPFMALSGVPVWGYAAAIFFVGVIFGALLRGNRKAAPLAALLFIVSATVPEGRVYAHEGHDHGGDKKALSASALTGDVPRRLEDGSLFVPKPTQRLLEVRTAAVKTTSVQPAIRFIGRVIADPNRSGLVQSVNAGRIVPPASGLPRLGQQVKKGDVLAEVDPPLTTGDFSDLAERTGQIDQQIALIEAKIRRFERLVATNAVATAQLDDAKTELEGLLRRKATIQTSKREREVLRAPVDGVITAARAVAGQVVEARDILFHIIDPASFWVEALAFDPRNAEGITGGHAVLEGGAPLKLSFKGKGRALQQHATQLQFAVMDAPSGLSIGLPVTVLAQRSTPVMGKIVPREAVVRGANGESIVFEHIEPERFIPRLVRVEPVDGTRVLIDAGIAERARVVVRGTELLNQVR